MKNNQNVLVVGGAGYIGSHCVRQLLKAGYQPVILDNLVFGHRQSVPENVSFVEGDLGDKELVKAVLNDHDIDVVMHFAAYAFVGESVEKPLKYYENNVGKTIALLQTMCESNVRKFIFSSTCASYGIPETLPINEELSQVPINPYGQTKLDVENLLKSLAANSEMSSAVFRYFNAAGAASDGSIGEQHDPETHLIPLAIEAATGLRPALKVFGTDYETPDGTCLRDYVHVDDLSRAHIASISLFGESVGFRHYNLGTGNPTSVKEIIDTVEKVTGLPVPHENAARRAGDPPSLYADSQKARQELGWKPKFTTIESIIESAWCWHKAHPKGFD
ncbi:MAG: UDP-glucose 4-epimerase GalE [Akkermansiaceae bacterium]